MNPHLLALLQGILGIPSQGPLISPEVVGGNQQSIPAPGGISNPVYQPSVTDLIKKYFPEDPKTAQAIFTHESQLGKYFKNLGGSNAYGIAQIMLPSHRDKIPGKTDQEKIDSLRDPEINLSVARRVYNEAGNSFKPWQSYTSGAYKKYLK